MKTTCGIKKGAAAKAVFKKTASLMLAIFLLANVLTVFTLNAQTNLLAGANPGFEAGYTAWGGSSIGNVMMDTVNPGEGVRSAKLPASYGNKWNTFVNNTGVISVVPGRSYQLSALTRQTLVGGTASLGLCEMSSTTSVITYDWKPMAKSVNWHSDFMTVAPGPNTHYLKVYIIIDPNATSGAVWLDCFRVIEVSGAPLTSIATDPFVDDTTAAVDAAPLPASLLNKSGTSISPGAIVPTVDFGSMLVGGTISWKVTTAASGTAGASMIQDSAPIASPGIWGSAIDVNSKSASFAAGNYLLTLNASNADNTLSRTILKSFTIQSSTNYAIAATTATPSLGTITGGGAYLGGDTATLVALPNPGAIFVNWTEYGGDVSDSNSFSFPVIMNRSFVANFQPVQFSAWQSTCFTASELTDPGISGPQADPDHDGIPNLLEYAGNLNARSPNLPGQLAQSGTDNGFLTLTYRRNKLASDLGFFVEVSSDLQTWNSGQGNTSAPVTLFDDGTTQTLKVSDLTPISSSKQRFIRLRVSQQ